GVALGSLAWLAVAAAAVGAAPDGEAVDPPQAEITIANPPTRASSRRLRAPPDAVRSLDIASSSFNRLRYRRARRAATPSRLRSFPRSGARRRRESGGSGRSGRSSPRGRSRRDRDPELLGRSGPACRLP